MRRRATISPTPILLAIRGKCRSSPRALEPDGQYGYRRRCQPDWAAKRPRRTAESSNSAANLGAEQRRYAIFAPATDPDLLYDDRQRYRKRAFRILDQPCRAFRESIEFGCPAGSHFQRAEPCEAFNTTANGLTSAQSAADTQVTQTVAQINSLTAQIAQLNGQVHN